MIRVRLSNGTTLDYRGGTVKQNDGIYWIMDDSRYIATVPKDAVIEFEPPIRIRYRKCLTSH